ncbi:MAG: hypothetical protein ACI4AN_08130 [Muribaculaceae bacterium]
MMGNLLKYFRCIVVVAIVLTIVAACTKNNGDIGVWFGLWKVTSVEVDGSADRKYKGNVYFSFQNTTFEQKLVKDDHSVKQVFGEWREADGKMTIIFPDKRYYPLDGYMRGDSVENVLAVERQAADRISLTLISGERQVLYKMEKWQ